MCFRFYFSSCVNNGFKKVKLHKTIVSPYEHQMIISYEFRSSSDIVTRLLELLYLLESQFCVTLKRY